MIVYLFKLNVKETDPKDIVIFFNFLATLVGSSKDIPIFNYLPSKKIAVIGSDISISIQLNNWIEKNVNFKLEYEEHKPDDRKLIQWNPIVSRNFTTYYLLPLFPPESYLEL